jgi:hypothetical protein
MNNLHPEDYPKYRFFGLCGTPFGFIDTLKTTPLKHMSTPWYSHGLAELRPPSILPS